MSKKTRDNNTIIDKNGVKKSNKKKAIITSIRVLLIIAVIVAVCITGLYAYWGRRHSIVYNAETFTVEHLNNDSYKVHIKGTAKPLWLFNKNSYTYTLSETDIGGMPDYSIENIKTNYINIENGKKAPFEIYAVFYPSQEALNTNSKDKCIEELCAIRLEAVDKNGNSIDKASFYFNDYYSSIKQIE